MGQVKYDRATFESKTLFNIQNMKNADLSFLCFVQISSNIFASHTLLCKT